MELGFEALALVFAGIAFPYVYQPIKDKLGLSGFVAFWFGFVVSVAVALAAGLLSGAVGLEGFPGFGEPVALIEWVSVAGAVVYAVANTVYFKYVAS